MTHPRLNVAVPWSLSHYILLNGFHPLYRALFDHAPDTVTLHAWDNVRLYRRFRADTPIRDTVVTIAKKRAKQSERLARSSVEARYQEYFWPPNQVLTTELFGDIEFYHTAPFPSMQRPFVLHCEMFVPMFFPFAHQGTGELDCFEELREHYRNILGNPLCLGVWSHVPETLASLRQFFSDPIIERKLFHSRMGLSSSSLLDAKLPEKSPLFRPRFLFMNSAHQNPANFFRRGGHIVLRFWKEFLGEGRDGLLMLRCARPSDESLLEHGVDVSMVRAETGRSIIWAQDFLANHEMNALMASAHFFLLPSASLHSVSIMQSMLLGTIPVVTDTVGTSVYVNDHETGVVLHGVRAALWYRDVATGILVDQYCRTPELDDSLASQLTSRVGALLDTPDAYQKMRTRTLAYAQDEFSGRKFSNHFWGNVSELCRQRNIRSSVFHNAASSQVGETLHDCIVQGAGDGWSRIFESPTQPMLRINTGQSVVVEWGGTMMQAYGNPRFELNDWSVLAQYYNSGATQVTFSLTLEELGGKYLHPVGYLGEGIRSILSRRISGFFGEASRAQIENISRLLKPFPRVHGLASRVLSKLRRGQQRVLSRMFRPKNEPDIELIRQGVSGYNVIRCNERYYAILQCEGAFTPHKVETGGYSSCFSDYSVEKVLQLIAEHAASRAQPGSAIDGFANGETLDSEREGLAAQAGLINGTKLK